MLEFTLGIPVYNDGKYLRKTLESCVHQASCIWLYDNCSTDDSTAICAEYASKYPHIKHVVHPENLGAFENFRRLLMDTKTSYFMWLGAHDILGDNYIQVLLDTIKKHPDAVLAVGEIHHINEDDSVRDKVTNLRDWSPALQNENDPLLRMQAFIKDHFGSRHDSFLLHGIFRTELLYKAWFDDPCLAFDDALLTRAAGLGKIVYNNDALFYARWFRKTRKKADEAKRIFRGGKIPETGGAMSRHIPTIRVIELVMVIANERQHTKDVFETISLIRHYVLSPKRARKIRRLKWISGVAITLLGLVGVLCFF